MEQTARFESAHLDILPDAALLAQLLQDRAAPSLPWPIAWPAPEQECGQERWHAAVPATERHAPPLLQPHTAFTPEEMCAARANTNAHADLSCGTSEEVAEMYDLWHPEADESLPSSPHLALATELPDLYDTWMAADCS